MSGYFARLRQRTGLAGAAAPRRRPGPDLVHQDVLVDAPTDAAAPVAARGDPRMSRTPAPAAHAPGVARVPVATSPTPRPEAGVPTSPPAPASESRPVKIGQPPPGRSSGRPATHRESPTHGVDAARAVVRAPSPPPSAPAVSGLDAFRTETPRTGDEPPPTAEASVPPAGPEAGVAGQSRVSSPTGGGASDRVVAIPAAAESFAELSHPPGASHRATRERPTAAPRAMPAAHTKVKIGAIRLEVHAPLPAPPTAPVSAAPAAPEPPRFSARRHYLRV